MITLHVYKINKIKTYSSNVHTNILSKKRILQHDDDILIDSIITVKAFCPMHQSTSVDICLIYGEGKGETQLNFLTDMMSTIFSNKIINAICNKITKMTHIARL